MCVCAAECLAEIMWENMFGYVCVRVPIFSSECVCHGVDHTK